MIDWSKYKNQYTRVVGYVGKKGKYHFWEIECVHCGNKKDIRSIHIRSAKSVNCECYRWPNGRPTPEIGNKWLRTAWL